MGSSSMVLSPPQNFTAKGTNDGGPVVEENLNSMQMEPHLDRGASESDNLVRSPSRTIGMMPMCDTTSHEHNIGSSGDVEELINKIEVSVLDIDQEADNKDKEKVVYGPTDVQKTNIFGTRRDIIPFFPEKASMPGAHNGITADSSSIKMDEPKLDLALVEPKWGDFNIRTSSGPFEGNIDVGSGNSHNECMTGVLASKVSTIKQCKLPATPMPVLTPQDSKHEGLASVIVKNCKNKMMTMGFTDSPPMEKPESTAENDFQLLKDELACVEVGMIVASQPADEGKQSPHQTNGILPKDDVASVEASPSDSRVPLYQREGKGKALSYAEVDGKTSKDEDDSHESVESCNSTGLLLARKRPWSFEQKLVIGNKEMKKQIQESPRSASSHRQDSSFMNWISNMVKGLGKSNMDETPLAFTTRPYHENGSHNQHSMFHRKKQESGCTKVGFETMFKSLYCPSTSVQEKKISSLDNQLEGSKELELINKTCDNSTTTAACGKEYNKLCKEIVIPNAEFNQITSVDGKGPSALPNVTSENISILQGNQKTSTAENSNSCSIACGLEKGGVILPNSSFRNDSDSPSEGKEACKPGSIDPNKSLKSMTNRSGLLGNLWINRFSPMVSGHMKGSSQCNQNADAAGEAYTDCSKLHSHSQNCAVSVKDQNIFEYGRETCAENQMDVASKKVQTCAFNTTRSIGSKRTTGHTDQKFKSKLNPIQPSQRFKSSEAMVSVFARRLDALRHIIASEVAVCSSHATPICFFCGIRGHKLQDCSKITESEIEDLLKNVNLYDGAEESSCLCIRCFQLNHWAISCPNTYSRKQGHLSNSSSMVNFRKFGKIMTVSDKDTHTNDDERNLSENKNCGCEVVLTLCDGKKTRVDNEVMVGTNINEKSSSTMILNARISDLTPTKKNLLGNYFCEGTSLKNTSREFILNKNQTNSSSTENELKENQVTSFCNFVKRQIPAVPRGTFEAIRRLRLSRTDILKWMQSRLSLFCLEGCFLRLRLCNREERLGGTGYFVACINGALRESSSGSSKIPLSVDIRGFKCSVESRFVSNHDFTEDELMAWWCATLTGGGKLPTEEHLKVKLEERRNFGF